MDRQGDQDEIQDADPQWGTLTQAQVGLEPGSDESGTGAGQAKDSEKNNAVHPRTAFRCPAVNGRFTELFSQGALSWVA